MRNILISLAFWTSFGITPAAAYSNSMEVSWYGPEVQGNSMANGRTFDMNDATIAAHRKLPFGTKLRLQNPDNGRSLLVTVQDRGPFVSGRDLDISKAAAERLGILGVGVKRLRVYIMR